MNDDLNNRLRVTAEEYEPDRDRMWARISDGMREPRVRAEPVRTGWRIPQLGLATGAALALIGVIVFFGQFLGIGPVVDPTPEPPAAGPGTRSEEATDPATSEDATTAAEETSADDGESESEATEGGSSPEVDDTAPDWLWTDGSVDPNGNDYWSQLNLTLKNEQPLAEVTVVLRAAVGAGVDPTGSWTSCDGWFKAAEVTEEDGFLVYRWTLQDGKVLPAGECILAGQFNHGAGARSADDDRYSFEAVTESGDSGTIEGDFE